MLIINDLSILNTDNMFSAKLQLKVNTYDAKLLKTLKLLNN